MKEKEISPIETLTEIRQLMERSSRFISLSGLSGVFAGISALIGAFAAFKYLDLDFKTRKHLYTEGTSYQNFVLFLLADAFLVLTLAIGTGIFLTTRKAKKDGNSLFDSTAKKLIINLCIPLACGGVLCISMLLHHNFGFIAPSMLLFYGLSLINASKYTLTDVRYLGFAEIGVGLISAFFIGYGLLFWAIGFGVLHIVYGTFMYFKYEK
jgi:hypothetical protein